MTRSFCGDCDRTRLTAEGPCARACSATRRWTCGRCCARGPPGRRAARKPTRPSCPRGRPRCGPSRSPTGSTGAHRTSRRSAAARTTRRPSPAPSAAWGRSGLRPSGDPAEAAVRAAPNVTDIMPGWHCFIPGISGRKGPPDLGMEGCPHPLVPRQLCLHPARSHDGPAPRPPPGATHLTAGPNTVLGAAIGTIAGVLLLAGPGLILGALVGIGFGILRDNPRD
ncbi:hypothetical protein NKG05_03550 [Oerskovia sp. M15]